MKVIPGTTEEQQNRAKNFVKGFSAATSGGAIPSKASEDFRLGFRLGRDSMAGNLTWFLAKYFSREYVASPAEVLQLLLLK